MNMKVIINTITVVATCLVISSVALADAEGLDFLRKLVNKHGGMPSLAYKMISITTIENQDKNHSDIISASVKLTRRPEVYLSIGKRKIGDRLFIANQNKVWLYDRIKSQYTENPAPKGKRTDAAKALGSFYTDEFARFGLIDYIGEFYLNGSSAMKNLKNPRILDEDRVGDKPVQVLQAVLKEGDQSALVWFYVETPYYYIRRVKITTNIPSEADKKKTISVATIIDYPEFKTDIEFPLKDFTFAPPKGVKLKEKL